MVPESENSSGVVLPWEQAAIRGGEMPNGLSYPDQILFQALAHLYARYRMKAIGKDQAVLEKKKLLDEYRVYQYREQMGDEWVQVIKNTELARAEFRKNPTVENGYKLIEAIEGRPSA